MNKNIRIIRKGTHWVLNGEPLICPECGAYEASIKRFPVESSKRANGWVWSFTSTCGRCLCEWNTYRFGEKMEE